MLCTIVCFGCLICACCMKCHASVTLLSKNRLSGGEVVDLDGLGANANLAS